jgi:hypothetical protein
VEKADERSTRKLCATQASGEAKMSNQVKSDIKGFPHGMITTQAEVINADILAFIR